MRRLLATLLGTLLMAWSAAAQEGAAAPPNTTPTPGQGAQSAATDSRSPLPNGLALEAELAKSVDSKKAKVGDEVTAKTAMDMLNNGQIVIPRGSKIIGHVTAAQPYSKGGSASLGMAFDKLVMKKGQEVPMHAVVQALAKPVENMQAGQGDDSGGGGGVGGGGMGGSRAPATGGMGRNTGTMGQGGPASGAGYPSGAAAGNDNNAPNGGQGAYGRLTPNARGVTGYSGVTLGEGNATQGTVLTSSKGNVHLDSGTQLVLRVVNQ